MDDSKARKKVYEDNIDDVVIDISQSSYWRKRLFEGNYDDRLLISNGVLDDIPEYLKTLFAQYGLKFYISKTKECSKQFDEGMVIFKVEALEFPELVRYSGNNDKII